MRLAFVFSLLLPSLAFAATGDEILGQVDKAIGNFSDQTILFEVQNMKPGTSAPQSMKFRSVTARGKNFVEFLAPGDLKGTRVLTTSASAIWIYLPEFAKIRKVASHNLNQGFMGTTLTQADIGTTGYGSDYNATLLSEDASTWNLDLTAKDPKNVGYAHLKMVVDKKMKVPTKIEYLAEDGSVVRTQTRSNYTCPKADYCMFGEMRMVDHTLGDAWTTLSPAESKIDTGVSDEVFTPRTLQLGL